MTQIPNPNPPGDDQIVAPDLSADQLQALEWPRLAPRVELVGLMEGTSYAERKWLICLDSSQYVQATELLYHLLLHADGRTSLDDIARAVTDDTGRAITPDELRWLLINRLAGSGLIVWPQAGGPGREPAKDTRLLAIKNRIPLLPYWSTAPFAEALQHLFWPPLMVLVLIAAVAVNVQVYRGAAVVDAALVLLTSPYLALILFGIDLCRTVFHELGHASALRKGGARHGVIGFALYVIFPVFYTDVTHSYRLGRSQRIRVDLGGMYFDCISMIAMFAIYRLTGASFLLLSIVFVGFSMLEQANPFMRFDGYYLIADTIGVPDPLALIRPLILHYLPGRRGKPSGLPKLRPWAIVLLFAYLAIVITFLTRPVSMLLLVGRPMLAALPTSGLGVWAGFLLAWRNHDVLLQMAATMRLVFWAIVPLGLILFAWSLLRLLLRILLALARPGLRRLGWYPVGATPPTRSSISGGPREGHASPSPKPAAATPLATNLATAISGPPVTSRASVPFTAPKPAPLPPTSPAPLPTPLNSLGRPVGVPAVRQRGDPLAAIESAAARAASLAQADLQQLFAALHQERIQLVSYVRGMEEAMTSLSHDLRRVGEGLVASADSVEQRLQEARAALQLVPQPQFGGPPEEPSRSSDVGVAAGG